MSVSPQQLDYAPQLPWHRRKSGRRALMWITLVAIGLSAMRWGPHIWENAQLYYLQGRCLTYRAPTDKVVYEGDAAKATLLMRSDPQYIVQSPSAPPGTIYFDRVWRDFYAALSPPGGLPGATLFLHERRKSDGTTRLVAVEVKIVCQLTYPVSFNYYAIANVFSAGNLLSRPKLIQQNKLSPFDYGVSSDRIFAGQPDEHDSSHFTIEHEINGQRKIIDGWLRDDDTVVLEKRDAASTITLSAPLSPGQLE